MGNENSESEPSQEGAANSAEAKRKLTLEAIENLLEDKLESKLAGLATKNDLETEIGNLRTGLNTRINKLEKELAASSRDLDLVKADAAIAREGTLRSNQVDRYRRLEQSDSVSSGPRRHTENRSHTLITGKPPRFSWD